MSTCANADASSKCQRSSELSTISLGHIYSTAFLGLSGASNEVAVPRTMNGLSWNGQHVCIIGNERIIVINVYHELQISSWIPFYFIKERDHVSFLGFTHTSENRHVTSERPEKLV